MALPHLLWPMTHLLPAPRGWERCRESSLEPREGQQSAPWPCSSCPGEAPVQRTGQAKPDGFLIWQGHNSPSTKGTSPGSKRHRGGNRMQRDGTSVWMRPNPSKKQSGFVLETHWERCTSQSPAVPMAAVCSLNPPGRVAAANYTLLA